ncbi:hypothetical protein MNBD_GAMMA11-1456 [hydrothermal vent metagenome]|uniref:Uncharacterized protein n=1 Tax=hydrothermal vent metagenome TaxID=652676 RepID=A0A3B0WPQ5_9ZZZZ
MFSTPDNQRIFGLLFIALIVSIIFGFTLKEARIGGDLYGAEFYIGGPVASFIMLISFFYKFHLFDQGLYSQSEDILNRPMETLSSVEEIENMIIDLKGQSERIANRISRLEDARIRFDKNAPEAAFSAMGISPARRGG